MKLIHFFIVTIVVLIVPFIMLLIPSFTWSLQDIDKSLLWNFFSSTADGWHAIVTSVVLLAIILVFYRKNWRLFLAISIYCFGAVIATQLVKETLKNVVKEPRPYVTQMATAVVAKLHESNKGAINSLDTNESRMTVKDFFVNMQTVYNLSHNINLLSFDKEPEVVTPNQSEPDAKLEVVTGAKPTVSDDEVATATTDDQQAAVIEQEPVEEDPATLKALAEGKGMQFLCDSCTTAEDLVKHFYKLNPDDREVFVKYAADYLFPENENPTKNHALMDMASDNSYSLPSGHAIFAATWLAIFCYIALASRTAAFYPVAALVFIWANGLSMSRVMLGFHYSHDVMMSHIIAAFLVSITFYLMLFIYRVILRLIPVKA